MGIDYSARFQIQVPLIAITASGTSTHGQPSANHVTATPTAIATSAETFARRLIARRSRHWRSGGPQRG